MLVGTLEIKLYAPWVHSLKEKRMVVQSLVKKLQSKFAVSAAEVAAQDIHQTIVVGVACVGGDRRHLDGVLDHVLRFVEGATEAEVVDIQRDIH